MAGKKNEADKNLDILVMVRNRLVEELEACEKASTVVQLSSAIRGTTRDITAEIDRLIDRTGPVPDSAEDQVAAARASRSSRVAS